MYPCTWAFTTVGCGKTKGLIGWMLALKSGITLFEKQAVCFFYGSLSRESDASMPFPEKRKLVVHLGGSLSFPSFTYSSLVTCFSPFHSLTVGWPAPSLFSLGKGLYLRHRGEISKKASLFTLRDFSLYIKRLLSLLEGLGPEILYLRIKMGLGPGTIV